MRILQLVLSTVVCGLAVTNVGAVPLLTVYNSRPAWEAAVGGSFLEEDFTGFNGVSYEFAPVDVGDFDVSVAGSTFGSSFHNIGPAIVPNDVNGTAQINAATGDVGGTTLSFDFPITAFGGFWDGVSDDRVTSFNVGGTILAIPHIEIEEGSGFFGFVSNEAFTAELLFLSSGEADGFAIDNVVYQMVPEPSTFLLAGLGLLGIAFRRRSRT
jgi:hypothetical protein